MAADVSTGDKWRAAGNRSVEAEAAADVEAVMKAAADAEAAAEVAAVDTEAVMKAAADAQTTTGQRWQQHLWLSRVK